MRFQAPESLSEQIAQHVGQRIVVGALRPGERIQELKIAGELDVSRGSVREALLILERRHLIQIFPRRGAVVSALSPDLVNNLYDIYIPLLLLLAEKAVEKWQPSDLTAISGQVRKLEKHIERGESEVTEVIEAGFEVMRLCYPIVRNPYLAETLENFRPAVSRAYHLAMRSCRGEAEASRSFFRELLSTAQDRSREGIEAAIRGYAEHQRQIVLDALAADSEATISSDSTL